MVGRDNKIIGDINQLISLLESSSAEQQQEVILNIEKEDPAKAALLRVRMLTVERVLMLDEESLGRVLEYVDKAEVIAHSLMGADLELRKRALKLINGEKRKDILQIIKDCKMTEFERDSNRRVFIQIARQLEMNGKIHFGAVRAALMKKRAA